MIDYSGWYIISPFFDLRAMISVRVLGKLGLYVWCILFSMAATAQFTVSTTIKPLQLIAGAITADILQPGLVLGASQDSHNVALRPSGRRMLANSELLLWVGPAMENALIKVVSGLSNEVISAQELSEIKRLYLKSNKSLDPHLWLNTNNAKIIAQAVARSAISLDSENKEKYLRNLDRFETSLDELTKTIQGLLAGYHNAKFGVYHNAFQYFEDQFVLQHVVSFTDDEELKPGIRHLLEVKEMLALQHVDCLLVEPDMNTDELRNIIEDENMRYISIDVMAYEFPVTRNGYVDFMLSLTESMVECLQ